MPVSAQIDILANESRLTGSLSNALRRAELRGFNPRLNVQGINTGLGTIRRSADQFSLSLAAAEARVLAFGATAGQLYLVIRGLNFLTQAAINVEKSLKDINVILNISSKNLEGFGNQLFRIAKETGQSFDLVAKSATEFARQGLSVEETLKRTRDALILTRLTGLDVIDSTESITAALNTFNKTVIDSTTLINKFAKVDAAFAVSSADLAEAIKRVGSTAQDVNVDLDSLVALVTSTQQTTARGGTVIGNAFKTIFQRIQRPQVLQQLSDLGIAVTDLQGQILPADRLLQNLANTYESLTTSQRNQIVQTAAGVYQANIFRAIIGDLARGELSEYNKALRTSSDATDEAIERNKELNTTLAALVNETLATFTQIGSKIGQTTLGPTISKIFSGINSTFDSENQGGVAQTIGKNFAQGILNGIGSFLSGPGLVILSAILLKLAGKFFGFLGKSIVSLLQFRVGVEGISKEMTKIVSEQERLQRGLLVQLNIEKQILASIQNQNVARSRGTNIISQAQTQLTGVGTSSIRRNIPRVIPPADLPLSVFAGGRSKQAQEDRQRFSQFLGIRESYVPFKVTGRNTYTDPITGQLFLRQRQASQLLGGTPEGIGPSPFSGFLPPFKSLSGRFASTRNEALKSLEGSANQFERQAIEQQQRQILIQSQRQAEIKRAAERLEAQRRLENIRNIRNQRFTNRTLGGAIAFPIFTDIANEFIGSEDTLTNRRSRALTGLGGNLGSGALGGAIFGSAFGSNLGPIGAVIGGTIGGITGLINVMREWNNVIPDLERSIENIKDTTTRTVATADELIRLVQLLGNPSLKKEEVKEINDRIKTLISQDPRFRGVSLNPNAIRERASTIITPLQAREASESFQKFLINTFDTRTGFTPIRIGERTQTIGFGPGARNVTTGIFQPSVNDSFANEVGKFFASFREDIPEIPNLFRSLARQPRELLPQLQQLLQPRGVSGEVFNRLKVFSDDELKSLFTRVAATTFNESSDTNLDKQLENLHKEQVNTTRQLIDNIHRLVGNIQDFSLNLEFANKNIIATAESEARIFEIRERGRLELTREGLSPFEILRQEGAIEGELIRRRFDTGRRRNIFDFNQGISTIGLSTLEGLRDDLFKEGGVEGNINLVRNLDSFRSNIENLINQSRSGGFNRDNALNALTFGRAILGNLSGEENDKLRNELNDALKLVEKTLKENNFLTEEEQRALRENTEQIEQNTRVLEQQTFEGLRARFFRGQFSRDELVSGLSREAARETREFGFQPRQGLQRAGQLFSAELSYNQTQFFDDIQTGAIEAARTFRTEFSQAFKDFARGASDAEEAFTNFALNIATQVQSTIIDLGINSLIGSIFGSKGVQNLTGSISVGGLYGANRGGLIRRTYSSGGLVTGGTGVKDDVPALLSSGEFVVNKQTVDRYGKDFFDTINNSANIRLTNEFAYNDPRRPTGGERLFSPLLTSFAFEDENNPQNRLRNSREEALSSYLSDLESYNQNREDALRAFRRQRRNQLIGTYVSSAISFGGAFLASRGPRRQISNIPNYGSPFLGSDVPIYAQRGGLIFGGESTTDNIPALLTGGEYVLRKDAVNRVGINFLNNINSGRRFANGGLVGTDTESHRDITDLLSKQIDSINTLNKTLLSITSQNRNVGQTTSITPERGGISPTIVSNITINMDGNGNINNSRTETSNSGPTNESEREKAKQLAETIRVITVDEIIKQTQQGGLISRKIGR